MLYPSFALLGSLLTLICGAFAGPISEQIPMANTTLSDGAIPVWEYYYNVNSIQHQTNFNKWSGTGYRMISLSAYGQPPNHRYAAVWVQRAGPAYFAIHEATGSQYQTFFDTHAPDGFVSTIITATGQGNNAKFAGVMEKNGVTNWYQRCGLTHDQYVTELNKGFGTGYILKSFTEYGTSADRRFCGVWYHNDKLEKYAVFVDETYDQVQLTFNNQVSIPGRRLGYLSISEDHLVSSEYVNTNVGSWFARLTRSTIDAEVKVQLAAGRYLIQLQGGGTGANINFGALFAEHDIPT